MRQRLGIAGALLRDPRLLLLDEPATGLDPAGMRDMRALVRRLADEGMTVLLSSHLMAEVEELCDRVAIVRTGRDRLRGRARRAARQRRPAATGCARPTTARAAAIAGAARHRATSRRRRRARASAPARSGGRRASLALGRGRHRASARSSRARATLEELFFR